MNTEAFVNGQRDCREGIKPASTDTDYLRGYGAQYELEQVMAWKTDQQMERNNEECRAK